MMPTGVNMYLIDAVRKGSSAMVMPTFSSRRVRRSRPSRDEVNYYTGLTKPSITNLNLTPKLIILEEDGSYTNLNLTPRFIILVCNQLRQSLACDWRWNTPSIPHNEVSLSIPGNPKLLDDTICNMSSYSTKGQSHVLLWPL